MIGSDHSTPDTVGKYWLMKLGEIQHTGIHQLLLLTLSLLILVRLREDVACVPFHIPGQSPSQTWHFLRILHFSSHGPNKQADILKYVYPQTDVLAPYMRMLCAGLWPRGCFRNREASPGESRVLKAGPSPLLCRVWQGWMHRGRESSVHWGSAELPQAGPGVRTEICQQSSLVCLSTHPQCVWATPQQVHQCLGLQPLFWKEFLWLSVEVPLERRDPISDGPKDVLKILNRTCIFKF